MDLAAILDNSRMPGFEFARDDVKAQARQAVNLGNGIDFFSGHDAGVAYRFFTHAQKNEMLSKKLMYHKADAIDMIQWFIDAKNKPAAMVRELPEELLQFDPLTGECVGGTLAEDYRRYKQGLSAPGLALSAWGELDICDLETLVNSGIFSVEQFAAQPDDKINRFHGSIQEAFQNAIQYVNGKQNRVQAEKVASELLEVTQKNSKLEDKLAAQQAQIDKLMAAAPQAVVSRRTKQKNTESANV